MSRVASVAKNALNVLRGGGKAAAGFGVGAVGMAAADMLIDPLSKIGRGVLEDFGAVEPKGFSRSIQADQQMMLAERVRKQKAQRLKQARAINIARLANEDPQLFNELLAGRELPPDAVVLGGQPRTDVLNEVADGMAMGQFQIPQE